MKVYIVFIQDGYYSKVEKIFSTIEAALYYINCNQSTDLYWEEYEVNN